MQMNGKDAPANGRIDPKDELVAMMARVYSGRMTTTSGGNISLKDDSGDVWITPAGIDKGCLTRDDIVRIRADGSVEGKHKPSSEYPFHLACYAARPDVRAVLHAHPPALVAFSAVDLIPRAASEPLVAAASGKIGIVPYALPGSKLLGEKIAGFFTAGCDVVLLENHGTVATGTTLAEAFRRFEALDFLARSLILAGGAPSGNVEPIVSWNADRAAACRPTPSASAGERAIREDLARFARRAYAQRLVTSSIGAFSARSSGDAFVVSKGDFDPQSANEGDFAKVSLSASGDATETERGNGDYPFAGFHRAVYRAHPELASIAFAAPPNLMSFLVSPAVFDSRIIPEAYILLRDVPSFELADFLQNPAKVAAALGEAVPLVFVRNLGAFVTGASPLQCYDRLEVAEFTAEGLLGAIRLGKIHRVEERDIDELKVAFKLK